MKKWKAIPLIGSVLTAIAASSCCILPLLIGAASAGSAGLTAAFSLYRPYLIGLTLLLLGAAFYSIYRPEKSATGEVNCCEPGSVNHTKRISKVILWAVTAFTLGVIAFPWLAKYEAWSRSNPPLSGIAGQEKGQIVQFNIPSMDCPACSLNIANLLQKTPGVYNAKVSFDAKRATVRYDAQRVSALQLRYVIDRTGFPATESVSQERPAFKINQKGHIDAMNDLEHLFSLELHYKGPIELAPIGDKVGNLVGGGDGSVTGSRLKGTVRWSNYETTGHDGVCSLQVPGLIRTDDGADIQFEGREMAMPLSGAGGKWKVAGVIRFKTNDQRYDWLNETLALTQGTFDYEAGLARWNVYLPK